MTCNDVYRSNRSAFIKIKKCNELTAFLIDVAKKHKVLHHFTTVDTLVKILNNKTWKFGSPKETNDRHELEKLGIAAPVIDPAWDHLFSSSFTHGDEDNMGMWMMYDQRLADRKTRKSIENRDMDLFPICISFSSAFLQGMVDEINSRENKESIFVYKENEEKIKHNNDFELAMNDIVYYHGYKNSSKARLCWGNIIKKMRKNAGDLATIGTGSATSLIGYVKNSAWEYEKETRITFKFKNPIQNKKAIYVKLENFNPLNDILGIRFSPFTGRTLDSLIGYIRRKVGNNWSDGFDNKFSMSYFYNRISFSNIDCFYKENGTGNRGKQTYISGDK